MKISGGCLNDLLKEGFNQTQVAQTCSMSRQGVSQRLKYKYKAPEIKMRRFLVKFLFYIGFDVLHISEYTGYKPETVRHYLYRWGYSRWDRCAGMEGRKRRRN